jgi:hypothetical protein
MVPSFSISLRNLNSRSNLGVRRQGWSEVAQMEQNRMFFLQVESVKQNAI